MNRGTVTKLVSLGSRAAAMGMTILLTLVVTRYFAGHGGAAPAGAFFYAFTTVYAVATVTRFGAETLALRLTAADPALGRPWARPAIWLTLLLGAPGLAITTVLVARTPAVATLGQGWTPWWVAAAFATAIVPINLISLAGSWLRALGRVAVGSYLELGGVATIVVAGVAAAWLLGHHALTTLLLLFAAAAWAVGLSSLALAVPLLRHAAPDAAAGTLREYLRRHGRALFSTMLTALGFFCFAYLPTLYLGMLHREADVAHFNVARMLANFVGLLATLQISYLSPQFAALQHADDREGVNRASWHATALATGFGLLVAAPLLLAPRWLMVLVGKSEEYAAGAPILRVLAVAVLLVTMLGQVYSLLLTREGLERLAGRITMVVLVGALLAMVAVTGLGAAWIAGASMLAPLGFSLVGHLALRRRGVHSAVWQLPGARAREGAGAGLGSGTD